MAHFILSAFADEASPHFDEQLAVLKEENIPLIELRGVDGKNCADLTLTEADEIRKKLDAHGIGLSSLGSPYGKFPIKQPFDEHKKQFRHGLELCKHLGCERIRMFSFFVPESETEKWQQEVFARLEWMLEEADRTGIALMHENEKEIYGYNVENCERLLDRFGNRMGFIFDPANFIQCGVNTLEAYDRLHGRISYMHIKDAILADGAVVCAGDGDGHVFELLKRLNSERKGNMILTIEPHLTVFSGLGGLQHETLKHHKNYYSQREAFGAACEALRQLLAKIEEV